MACSRACLSLSGVYSGSARDESGQAVWVYGVAPKQVSLGSCEMYVLARSGRLIGLQWITLCIPKHWCIAS